MIVCSVLAMALLSAAPADGQAPPWPTDLLDGATAVVIERQRGTEPRRAARVERRGKDWRVVAPRRGEADPDAMGRLFLALRSPQILGALPAPPDGPIAFTITLWRGSRGRRVTIWDAPLDQPRPVAVERAGVFLVSPVELATKVPDPQDFLPAGLWVSAATRARSLRVEGPVSYALRLDPRGEWVAEDGRRAERKLKGVVAVITGRNAVGTPEAPAERLGLDPPTATATLCATRPGGGGRECRTFRFGAAEIGGQQRAFAVGPDMDPVELRDDEWRLLVHGPFTR